MRNSSRVSISAQMNDEAPDTFSRDLPSGQLPVPAGGAASVAYTIEPRARGDAQFGDVWLRYSSPLRLAERWARARLAQTVRVYPNLDEAQRMRIYLIRSRQIELEKRLKRQRGHGREFESLREYRAGDEFRDISWSATARRGKLITKVYQIERSQTVWLVLDAGRLLRARVDDAHQTRLRGERGAEPRAGGALFRRPRGPAGLRPQAAAARGAGPRRAASARAAWKASRRSTPKPFEADHLLRGRASAFVAKPAQPDRLADRPRRDRGDARSDRMRRSDGHAAIWWCSESWRRRSCAASLRRARKMPTKCTATPPRSKSCSGAICCCGGCASKARWLWRQLRRGSRQRW